MTPKHRNGNRRPDSDTIPKMVIGLNDEKVMFIGPGGVLQYATGETVLKDGNPLVIVNHKIHS